MRMLTAAPPGLPGPRPRIWEKAAHGVKATATRSLPGSQTVRMMASGMPRVGQFGDEGFEMAGDDGVIGRVEGQNPGVLPFHLDGPVAAARQGEDRRHAVVLADVGEDSGGLGGRQKENNLTAAVRRQPSARVQLGAGGSAGSGLMATPV